MIEASRRDEFTEPILHIHHTDLIADPTGTVASVYRHFGLAWTPDLAARIGAYTAEHPNGGYGQHAYRFDDHGLDPTSERERFADYVAWFDISEEMAAEGPHRELLTA
jgi:hypothetical protein